MKELVVDARNSEGAKAFEEAILASVRRKHGITAATPEEAARGKKRKQKAPVHTFDAALFDEDDEQIWGELDVVIPLDFRHCLFFCHFLPGILGSCTISFPLSFPLTVKSAAAF